MPEPVDPIARRFYQAAYARYEEAEILLREGRFTGEIYLAGYGVECMLKVLVLSEIDPGRHVEMERAFRGSRAHDFEWLRSRYALAIAPRTPAIPDDIASALAYVGTWETWFRYEHDVGNHDDAVAFLRETKGIMEWIDGLV